MQGGSGTNGYRVYSATVGPLGQLSLQDTPYSIHVTPGELIENRVAHNSFAALQTDPVVAPLMSSDGYSSMQRIMVRGFSASDQSELRDGLTDRSFTIQPMENVERVEVLDGFSSFLYGFSSLGGSVNFITKTPTPAQQTILTAGLYDNGIVFGQIDAGGPLSTNAGYRINLYDEDGVTYAGEHRQRDLVSVDLVYRLNENSHLNFSVYHQDLDETGIATYFNNSGIGYQVPKAFDPDGQYGQPWTYDRSEKDVFSLALDTELNDTFTLRTAVLFSDMWREYRYVANNITNVNGSYTESMVDTPPDRELAASAYALMDAHFDTWEMSHTLTFGCTYWWYMFWRGADRTMSLGPSTIQYPVGYVPPGSSGTIDRKTWSDDENFLLGDRINIAQDWILLAGASYSVLDTRYFGNYLPGSSLPSGYSGPTSSRPETTGYYLTPSAALLYKLQPDVSIYASYMQGIQPGGVAPNNAQNAGAILPASASEQYEAGIKAAIAHSFDLSLAAFRMEEVNDYVDPADNVYKASGREVHQGLELLGSGLIWDRLTAIGGLTIMSANVEKAANASTDGSVPVSVPEQLASLHLEYRLPELEPIPGVITLCAGSNYLGKRPVDVPNTQYMPGVTLFDAGLRYQPIKRLILTLNVSNLADTRYWEYYRTGDGLLLGAPRVYAVSIRYTL